MGTDTVDVVIDVNSIGYGLLMRVLHHQVLVKEPEGLLAGCGGEADEVGVEVLEHLRPEIVDGAVTFIGNDDIKGLDGDGRVVFDGLRLFEELLQAFNGHLLIFLTEVSALEHGEHTLNGADTDPSRGVEGVAGQALNDILLGELEIAVGRDVLLEFLQGLVAQVATVDEKQDPPGAAKFNEPIDEVDGGEGLSTSGGHLNQGTGAVFGHGLFQILDGFDLSRPETFFL